MRCQNCTSGDPASNGLTFSYHGDKTYTVNICQRCAIHLLGQLPFDKVRRATLVAGWIQERLPMK